MVNAPGKDGDCKGLLGPSSPPVPSLGPAGGGGLCLKWGGETTKEEEGVTGRGEGANSNQPQRRLRDRWTYTPPLPLLLLLPPPQGRGLALPRVGWFLFVNKSI